MEPQHPNWSELLHDLLTLIAKKINLIEDFLSFGSVCKSWNSVATRDNFNSELPRVPWLMLAEEEGNPCHKFVSLYNGMILNKTIPKACGKKCIESNGWLFTIAEDDDEISLLHPCSGVYIQLPHPSTTHDFEEHRMGCPLAFHYKAVLSTSPSHSSDFVVMVIGGNLKFLSFWRPGDSRWTRLPWDTTTAPLTVPTMIWSILMATFMLLIIGVVS